MMMKKEEEERNETEAWDELRNSGVFAKRNCCEKCRIEKLFGSSSLSWSKEERIFESTSAFGRPKLVIPGDRSVLPYFP
ncbi:hypothetical protein G5I_05516 [Acromyrmex echinatior]|uniref:Uncharacterized protein n=1 Tax=Acromyrmex echinatior TaxID=103372 RepID=F4WIJ2_ACREC|nr:hypothetical protein G5I_05516 [Acromyrmex echinatior]